MRKIFLFFALCFTLSSIFIGCKKEKFSADANNIQFSVDTLFFDTVFTDVGTATRNIKIYNTGKATLKISRIQMRNTQTFFRINADGLPGPVAENIEIPKGDSIFLFMEATIDPNGSNTPLVVEDAIEVFTETNAKSLPVIAWGQDAVYIKPDLNIGGLPIKILDPQTTWTKEKPVVIFGYAVVDSTNSLTIEPGTQIHFHSDAGLWIYRGGKFNATGSMEEPIVFQGDRLESFYDEVPGQWDRIIINESDAEDHIIKNCVIKNSIIGLQVETLQFPYNVNAPTSSNKLQLENVIIRNQSLAGMLLKNYKIKAGNVGIYNAGQYAVAIAGGGEYQFSHFSILNYWTQTVRSDPSFFVTNAYEDINRNIQVRQITNSYLENSIVYGSEDTEFSVSYLNIPNPPEQDFAIRNNIIKSEEGISNIPNQNIQYGAPFLEGNDREGYKPTINSPAVNAGVVSDFPTDILGKVRDSQPDLGIFELD